MDYVCSVMLYLKENRNIIYKMHFCVDLFNKNFFILDFQWINFKKKILLFYTSSDKFRKKEKKFFFCHKEKKILRKKIVFRLIFETCNWIERTVEYIISENERIKRRENWDNKVD